MQWDDSENGGFTCGKPWIKCNDNYRKMCIRDRGNSKSPLIAMTVAALINVGLDLLFVAVFGWGVAGEMCIRDRLTTGHARALLGIEDQNQQYVVAQQIFDQKLSRCV